MTDTELQPVENNNENFQAQTNSGKLSIEDKIELGEKQKEEYERLIEYRKKVSFLADSRSKVPFKNSTSMHAAIVFENIFRVSNLSVKIFTGSLNKEVSNHFDYTKELVDFVARGGRIQILSEEELDSGSNAVVEIKKLQKLFPNEILTKVMNTENDLKGANHFIVADKIAYRVETDATERTAFVCFNDEKNGEFLTGLFDEHFKN